MKTVNDVYDAVDGIEVCRKCGCRVELIKIFPKFEVYRCANPECGTENESYEYRVMIEDEEQFEEEEIDNVPPKNSKEYWG